MNVVHEEDISIKRAGNSITYKLVVCKSIDVKGIQKIIAEKGPLTKVLVFYKITSCDKSGRPTGINNKLRKLSAADPFQQVDIIYCQNFYPDKEKMTDLAVKQIQNLADKSADAPTYKTIEDKVEMKHDNSDNREGDIELGEGVKVKQDESDTNGE